jgi:Tol biopolymer transport system component
VAADGRFAFADIDRSHHIWSVALNANEAEVRGEPEPFTSGGADEMFPTVSDDGKGMVYRSDKAGNWDIWYRNLETGEGRQLTASADDEGRGILSPDGRRVAIVRAQEVLREKESIFVRELASGDEKKLILSETGLSILDWSPDSRRILYSVGSPFRFNTVDIETGKVALAIAHPELGVDNAQFSPDGRWVSFLLLLSPGQASTHIAPLEGGRATNPERWIRLTEGTKHGRSWWSPDGSLLYFQSARDGYLCIWAQRLDPETKHPLGGPIEVLHFHHPGRRPWPTAFGYGMTSDRLYFVLVETTANIWLAEPLER